MQERIIAAEIEAPIDSPPQSRSRARLIYWAIALALAGVFLYFALRGIDWKQVWHLLSRADLRYLAYAFGVSSVALLIRALRWRILLRSRAPVDVPTAFWATSAGYFGNNFLPARAGELVRTMMVSTRAGLSKTFVLTTALSERVSDAIVLVTISSIVLLTLPTRPGVFEKIARPSAIVGLAGVLVIAVLPKLESVWKRLLSRVPLPYAFSCRVQDALDHVLSGIRAYHDAGRLSRFLAATIVIWFLDAIGTMIAVHSLHLSVSMPVAFLLITGLALGSALPSTPGYVGIYQFMAVSVLTPFGFSRTDAIAYILLAQALQYVLTSFWGLWGLARGRRAAATA